MALLPIAVGWKVLLLLLSTAGFILLNVFVPGPAMPTKRLAILSGGAELIIHFLVTLIINSALLTAFLLRERPFSEGSELFPPGIVIAHIAVFLLSEVMLFWNGIIRIYLTSVQMGIRHRAAGLLLGWIPLANVVVLLILCRVCVRERRAERERVLKNRARRSAAICATKYPILLVHGVFFRDIRYLNYWGRIPRELERNGARVFYGNQQSASSVADSGLELARRIQEIVRTTGCEKVNIIAHSKGGLDSRYAISRLGMDEYVASLTTINTPHYGCLFAEYLLHRVSEDFKNSLAKRYNSAMRSLGDTNPDFLAAVEDLTASSCQEFNKDCPDSEQVVYRSVGSKVTRALGGRFPLNLTYHFVKHFDGPNDGLVSVDSSVWGKEFRLVSVTGRRGVSHADIIDLNRENIPGFDVREFYVSMVNRLKRDNL